MPLNAKGMAASCGEIKGTSRIPKFCVFSSRGYQKSGLPNQLRMFDQHAVYGMEQLIQFAHPSP
jgi:hypothetical protein